MKESEKEYEKYVEGIIRPTRFYRAFKFAKEIKAKYSDPDGDTVNYFWFLNNKKVSAQNKYTFNTDYNSSGQYKLRVDSSAVVGLMTSLVDEPVKTASIGFDEQKFNDELTDGDTCPLPEPIRSQKAIVNLIRAEIARTSEKYNKNLHYNKPDKDFWDKPHSKIKDA